VSVPSLEELGRAPSMTLNAPSASLAELFDRAASAYSEELLRQMSFLPNLFVGAGVTCAVAAVAGVARLLGAEPAAQFVFCCVVGTVYGVFRILLGTTRFVSKRTGQDITVAIPLVLGFGYGLFAWMVEAVLALLPVPSVVPTPLLALVFLALWFRRRGSPTHLDRVPHLGTTRALMHLADPAAVASVEWNGRQYRAQVTRSDGARVTCTSEPAPQGEALQVVVDFPPSYRWRHATPQLVIDGLTLESRADADGVHVRTTNTHALASGRLFLQALSVTANACTPPTQPAAGPLPSYGA